jgi:glycosyltransferase involved in cell wall biosynthesis
VTALPSSPALADAQSVTLAYLSGSATHDIDLGTIAAPLAAVLARFDQARLLLVGPVTLPPALRPFAESGQILRHCFVPWQDLPGLLTYCRVDINLAPLDTNRPFMHAKSEVKFLEAAAVGIPTIASPAAGFAEGVRSGTDCLLASSPGVWERLLTDLIEDPARRTQIGAAARESVHARGTSASNTENVRSVFEKLANLAPASTSTTGAPSVRFVRL